MKKNLLAIFSPFTSSTLPSKFQNFLKQLLVEDFNLKFYFNSKFYW